MFIYNVGDTIRVKAQPIGNRHTPTLLPSMRSYFGKVVTITEVFTNSVGEPRCHIHEDRGAWIWCDAFFEPYDTSKESYEYW